MSAEESSQSDKVKNPVKDDARLDIHIAAGGRIYSSLGSGALSKADRDISTE